MHARRGRAFSIAGLFLALLLAACETVVDVTPPPHTPKLVAQSFFTPDGLWIVRVSHTTPFTDAAPPGLVDSATVEIWDGEQLLAQPTRSDTGTYVAIGRGARPGRTYTLRVDAPNFPPIEGRNALPGPVPVSAFQTTLVQPTDTASRRRITQIDITLDDPPNVDNFYGLLVLQVRWREDQQTGQLTPMTPSLFPFQSSDPALGESEFDFLNTDQTLYREAFFTDGLFDGSTYTIDFDIQYDAPRPEAPVVIRRVFAVALLSVSEDFYRYWETANEQALTNENPFAEPLRVHSNMAGGFGVFAGFRYSIFPVGIDRLGVGGLQLGDLCRFIGSRLPLCTGPPPATVP
jgi:hypothetical protein